MNCEEFQKDLFSLEKKEQLALIKTLRKITQLNWNQLYKDAGLKWENIIGKQTASGDRIYSFRFSHRFSQKYRGTALRQGDYLRLLTLHVDHDGAYH